MPDSNCCFLACIHFLRRWSDIPISLRIFWFAVIHTVTGFSVVNKPEVDVFLEFSCFLYDPTNVGNLVSGSSAFSKPACISGSSWFMFCWKWKSLSCVWLYSPWNSPGQNTGVDSLSLFQGIFPTQGLNPGLTNYRWILYQLSHKGSPRILECSLSLLQQIFLTQESNHSLLHYRQVLYQLNYQGSLAWKILSITSLACEMSTTAWYFKHSLALPFFDIGMKTDLF